LFVWPVWADAGPAGAAPAGVTVHTYRNPTTTSERNAPIAVFPSEPIER
jgi:hypothetical protein